MALIAFVIWLIGFFMRGCRNAGLGAPEEDVQVREVAVALLEVEAVADESSSGTVKPT